MTVSGLWRSGCSRQLLYDIDPNTGILPRVVSLILGESLFSFALLYGFTNLLSSETARVSVLIKEELYTDGHFKTII